ncbi:MAG: cupin domain-containing protein [Prolixibacteraceae bacterium]|jgi:quercetin dioxygenase-like cupin family protein|nr:cupin domain-containing protein [Prolixibacteraceae bacterium]
MKYIFLVFLLICCLSWQSNAQYNNDLIIEPILKTDTTSLGQKINYPNTTNSEVTMLKITIPPGKTTGWHKHDNPVFAYVLKGTLSVELEDNKVLKFAENSSFSEVIHTAHRGINKEGSDLVLIAIYLGEKGKPLSLKKETP